MARKKPSRHKARRHMVSLPTSHYEAISQLARRNRRNISVEVMIAIEERCKAEGLWPPPEGASQ